MVLAHPFVIGELALAGLRPRENVLNALSDLPHASIATDAEVLHFIDRHTLFGCGIGYDDAHLLAAVQLTPGAVLWTKHKRLRIGEANTTYVPFRGMWIVSSCDGTDFQGTRHGEHSE